MSSLAIHLEQHRHARIERAELVALVAVLAWSTATWRKEPRGKGRSPRR